MFQGIVNNNVTIEDICDIMDNHSLGNTTPRIWYLFDGSLLILIQPFTLIILHCI